MRIGSARVWARRYVVPIALASLTIVRAAILVAGDRQRQAEGEKQPDDAEQCALQDPKRLSEVLREVPNAVAQEDPETRRTEDHRKEEEAQLQAREPKEDDAPTLLLASVTALCVSTSLARSDRRPKP